MDDPTDEELRLQQMMDALDVSEDEERETCLLCGCIIGEEAGVGLRNPDGSGRCWCDNCYDPESTLLLDGEDDGSGLPPHQR